MKKHLDSVGLLDYFLCENRALFRCGEPKQLTIMTAKKHMCSTPVDSCSSAVKLLSASFVIFMLNIDFGLTWCNLQ